MKNGKTNELGFQELAAIHPFKSIYGGTIRLYYPYLITRDTSPQGRIWKSSDLLHRMDAHRPQPA
jgi:hypothetical protein